MSASLHLPSRRLAAACLSSRPAALSFRDRRPQAGKQVGDDRIKSSHSDNSGERPDYGQKAFPKCRKFIPRNRKILPSARCCL